MIDWIHAGPSVTAAFLGSLVECVEALTIVLAVGTATLRPPSRRRRRWSFTIDQLGVTTASHSASQ